MLSQAPYNQTNDIKFLLTRMRIVVTHIFHPPINFFTKQKFNFNYPK